MARVRQTDQQTKKSQLPADFLPPVKKSPMK
jgi:hypothetical protein